MTSFAWGHLLILAVALVAVVLAVVFAVRSWRRSRKAGESSTSVVSVTLSVAALWATFSVFGAIIVTATILLQPQVQITIPVQDYWPKLPSGMHIEGMTATRASGGFTSADLQVDGLSLGARITWAISQALGWLVPGAIAGLIALACFHLLAGRAFAPVVARMAMVTAVVVAAGGVATQVLGDIAGSMAAAEVLHYTGGGWDEIPGAEDPLDMWWPHAAFTVSFPFLPLAAGLAFAALAALLKYGAKLQRDTEGLV
nr:hypothetical protein [Microbacterium bovistercoris]